MLLVSSKNFLLLCLLFREQERSSRNQERQSRNDTHIYIHGWKQGERRCLHMKLQHNEKGKKPFKNIALNITTRRGLFQLPCFLQPLSNKKNIMFSAHAAENSRCLLPWTALSSGSDVTHSLPLFLSCMRWRRRREEGEEEKEEIVDVTSWWGFNAPWKVAGCWWLFLYEQHKNDHVRIKGLFHIILKSLEIHISIHDTHIVEGRGKTRLTNHFASCWRKVYWINSLHFVIWGLNFATELWMRYYFLVNILGILKRSDHHIISFGQIAKQEIQWSWLLALMHGKSWSKSDNHFTQY